MATAPVAAPVSVPAAAGVAGPTPRGIHLVLMGDGTLDNAHALPGGSTALTAELTDMIEEAVLPMNAQGVQIEPAHRKVTCLANSSACTAVSLLDTQVPLLPPDATHVVISVGAVDAEHARASLAAAPSSTALEALSQLAAAQHAFESALGSALERIGSRGLPILIFVPTDLSLIAADSSTQMTTQASLALFADVIYRQAARHGLALADLRLVLTDASDFSRRTSTSVAGASKVCYKISEWLVRKVSEPSV